MTGRLLDPFSEVVDERRRWTPDWYRWLDDLDLRTLRGVVNISGARSLTNDMNNSIIMLGGNSFYDFTIPDPVLMDDAFYCLLMNNDDYPGGRGKRIVPAAPASSDFPQFILWPKQSLILFNTTNRWHTSPDVNKGGFRWKLDGTLTFFINQGSGNNANDGLVTGAGAMASMQGAFTALCQSIDANGQTIVFQLDDGSFNTGLAFNQSWTGGGVLIVQGNETTPDNTFVNVTAIGSSTGYPFLVTGYPGGAIFIRKLKMASNQSGAIGVGVLSTASVQIVDVTLGDCPLSFFHGSVGGAALFISGAIKVVGNSGNLIISSGAALVSIANATVFTFVRNAGKPTRFSTVALNAGSSASLNASLASFVNDAGKSRVTATGDVTIGSNNVTNLVFPSGDTSQLSTGMSVIGSGIPYAAPPTDATTVTSILSANSIQFSGAAASGTTLGATVKFEVAHGIKYFSQSGAVILGPTGAGVDGPPGDAAGAVVPPGSFVG